MIPGAGGIPIKRRVGMRFGVEKILAPWRVVGKTDTIYIPRLKAPGLFSKRKLHRAPPGRLVSGEYGFSWRVKGFVAQTARSSAAAASTKTDKLSGAFTPKEKRHRDGEKG